MRNSIIHMLVLAWLLGGCAAPAPAGGQSSAVTRPASLDLATTQPSTQGLFTVAYTSDLDPLTINKLHTWTLHVVDSAGAPLNSATLTVDGGMPEHNHGMPTQPIVTPLGDGDYRVEGMKFQMPGWWTVTVTVTDTVGGVAQGDSATFNLVLQ